RDNFPVTESAPVTEIDVNPAPGCDNFPVTESAPLTDILVAPSAGDPEFLTLTKKRAPAIADLQAITGFVRKYEYKFNVGAPTFFHDIYEVPVGRIFRLEFISAHCLQDDPSSIRFNLRSGGADYWFYDEAYGLAYESHSIFDYVLYNEEDIVRITWDGTAATNDMVGMIFGTLYDRY
ncbi:unnamed protein product, partial [marine sediment metagenome]